MFALKHKKWYFGEAQLMENTVTQSLWHKLFVLVWNALICHIHTELTNGLSDIIRLPDLTASSLKRLNWPQYILPYLRLLSTAFSISCSCFQGLNSHKSLIQPTYLTKPKACTVCFYNKHKKRSQWFHRCHYCFLTWQFLSGSYV